MQKPVSDVIVKGWQPETEETHQRWLLANHPSGAPSVDDFMMVEDVVPAPAPGQLLVRSLYLSVDPFQRLIMNATPRNVEVVPLYGVMLGDIVGEVVKSHHPDFKDGDVVNGVLGWQNYALTRGAGHYIHNRSGLRVVDESLGPLNTAASVLGRPGMTAYFSVMRECMPKPGDVMVVSTAAGAVGHLAGQIGKIHGATVIGITSSEEKISFLTEEMGFDAGLNYKAVNDIKAAVKRACPNGVDIYYDNVGGPMAEAILTQLNPGGRVTYVGSTEQYNTLEEDGSPWTWKMDKPMFIIHDYIEEYDAGRTAMSAWMNDGKLQYRDDIIDGLENAPEAFIGLFAGTNIGKRLVRVNRKRLNGENA
ncbi:MAG: NADP-dependent oxidoreductase [Rhodospirillaceae bacterium]